MMTREEVMSKIEKLLRLGKSPNENEAKVAMAHASRLMQEHQIEMHEVLMTEAKTEQVRREFVTVEGQKMKLVWVVTLAGAAARLYDGRVIMGRELHSTSFWFVGFPKDIPLMRSTFDYLYNSWFGIVEYDLKEAKAESGFRFAPKDTMRFKHGHGVAFAQTLNNRCYELTRERAAVVAKSTALVVVKDAAVKQFMQTHSVTRKSRQSAGSPDGAAYGRRAGQSVPLGGAIEQK